ncbi:hypothetical protein USDA257_c44750 [Sinorhizobium fredii USDA 257]|uniref:Uncharacterized protein n=1 Tax=Sinorhizobium fredii (strain USDA 257) TaxID=1185652 RepID=I3XAV7_SINF2|nr:hypothetical protein USDA257_c44750 [Sinorhizobium fredii USDA 257]
MQVFLASARQLVTLAHLSAIRNCPSLDLRRCDEAHAKRGLL